MLKNFGTKRLVDKFYRMVINTYRREKYRDLLSNKEHHIAKFINWSQGKKKKLLEKL